MLAFSHYLKQGKTGFLQIAEEIESDGSQAQRKRAPKSPHENFQRGIKNIFVGIFVGI